MVSKIAKGMAKKICETGISQKCTSQLLSLVGEKDFVTGKVSTRTSFICPKYTKPVKKTTVRGVP